MPHLETGDVENIEPVWLLNGTAVSTSSATLTLREWSTGTARYWTGAAWTTTPTTLSFTSGRYTLTIPTGWAGLVVEVICALTGYPDLTDEISVQTPTTSTNLHSDIT